MNLDFVDAGIRPLIRELARVGVITRFSCEGHGDSRPYVAFDPIEGDELERLKAAAQRAGWAYDDTTYPYSHILDYGNIGQLTAEIAGWPDAETPAVLTDSDKNEEFRKQRKAEAEKWVADQKTGNCGCNCGKATT